MGVVTALCQLFYCPSAEHSFLFNGVHPFDNYLEKKKTHVPVYICSNSTFLYLSVISHQKANEK